MILQISHLFVVARSTPPFSSSSFIPWLVLAKKTMRQENRRGDTKMKGRKREQASKQGPQFNWVSLSSICFASLYLALSLRCWFGRLWFGLFRCWRLRHERFCSLMSVVIITLIIIFAFIVVIPVTTTTTMRRPTMFSATRSVVIDDVASNERRRRRRLNLIQWTTNLW